jgi:hypothetical protein
MNNKTFVLALFLIIITVFSCKKTEEIIIDGNVAPPDPTLANNIRTNFINKSYIALIGRKPNEQELSQAVSVINNNENFTEANRGQVIDQILAKNEFYNREFIIAKSELLNAIDTSEIRIQILIFEALLQNTDFEYIWPFLLIENNRLEKLYNTQSQLLAGSIEMNDMHSRMVNNYFYDQINMGSLNFVIAVFQQFLLRNPTQAEADQGVRMVDQFGASLFLQIGESREDFCNIFFNSTPYYEGQVKLLYNRFLFRLPNSEEMSALTAFYKGNKNYKALIKKILTTDEYAGI